MAIAVGYRPPDRIEGIHMARLNAIVLLSYGYDVCWLPQAVGVNFTPRHAQAAPFPLAMTLRISA
eukprot:1794758-Lingulodinium_polyedra.AAC.1